MEYRTEKDSLGEVRVPATALYGAQTQRATDNFQISGEPLPDEFLRALALIKAAAATVNARLGLLDSPRSEAIADAAEEIFGGAHADQFPVDVFQTGSGTSTNMNMNEVLARLASASSGLPVHPNDHVNMSQSSNDVVPTALQISACIATERNLLPAIERLEKALEGCADEHAGVIKTGRTHLMDAMPLRLEQEISAWAEQQRQAKKGIEQSLPALQRLPLGGTAVGTGVNAPEEFGASVVKELNNKLGADFQALSGFRNLGSQDAAVAFSGQLNVLATALMKLCNDLRWMNSGPLSGLAEIQLKALQPGSSIMPGKVNPVIPEAVAMVCAQVTGLHVAVTIAGQSGNFQLNVMLPLIAYNLLHSVKLLANSCAALADKAIAGLGVNSSRIASSLSKNPVLVTALNGKIGYEKAAMIAKEAAARGQSVLEVALEHTDLTRSELEVLLNPERLTHPGVPDTDAG